MTGLFDRDILMAALGTACGDPARVSALLAANGGEPQDFGGVRPLYRLATHLADLHARGERFEREIAISMVAESTGADRTDIAAIMQDIEGRANPAAFNLFLGRLRILRFRRQLAELGERAQNLCPDAELLTTVQDAVRDIEAGGDDLAFADLSAAPPPAPPVLVGRYDSTLLARGDKVAVAADSGTGKTHFLVALALGIASGREVLEFDCAQQPVLYLSSDDDPDLVRKFHRHWAGMGGTPDELLALPLRIVSDSDFNFDEPGAVARVRKALAGLGADKRPATLIVESLTTNVIPRQTDINDGVSVRAYIRSTFSRLQAEFPGLTALLSHHLKKPQRGGFNDPSTRVSGSVQIRAGVDCVIGLSRDGTDSFYAETFKRSRTGAQFTYFKVRIAGAPDEPLSLQRCEGDRTQYKGSPGAVLAFLQAAGGPQPLKAIVAGITSHKERAVQWACKKLATDEPAKLIKTGTKKAPIYALAPDATPKPADIFGDLE